MIGAAAGTAAAVALIARYVPLGVPGECVVSYIRLNTPAVLVGPLIPALALVLVTWWGVSRGEHALERCVALAGLVIAGSYFAFHLGMAGPVGLGEPISRTLSPKGLGTYLVEAQHIGPYRPGHVQVPKDGAAAPDPLSYLRHFDERVAARRLDANTVRLAVNPPGATLVVWAVDWACRSGSRRRAGGALILRRSGWPRAADLFPRRPAPSGEELAGVVLLGLGSLTVALTALAIYALGFDLSGSRRTAFGAAALWLTVPSVLLHMPALEQLTPFLALLLALCWYRACARRSVTYAVLTGLVAWIGLFFTLEFAAVIVLLALVTLLWAAVHRGPWRHWWLGATAVAAALAVTIAAWLAFDYDTVFVLYQCARRTAEWNATLGARSYGAWLQWNPVMFALFFGAGATVLWLAGIGAAIRQALTSRRPPQPEPSAATGDGPRSSRRAPHPAMRWIPATAVAVTMLAVWLTGLERGEVERRWSLWMALAFVAGAVALSHPAHKPGSQKRPLSAAAWMALLLLQLALVFALRYRVDVQDAIADAPKHLPALKAKAPQPRHSHAGGRQPGRRCVVLREIDA